MFEDIFDEQEDEEITMEDLEAILFEESTEEDDCEDCSHTG